MKEIIGYVLFFIGLGTAIGGAITEKTAGGSGWWFIIGGILLLVSLEFIVDSKIETAKKELRREFEK